MDSGRIDQQEIRLESVSRLPLLNLPGPDEHHVTLAQRKTLEVEQVLSVPCGRDEGDIELDPLRFRQDLGRHAGTQLRQGQKFDADRIQPLVLEARLAQDPGG